MMQERTPRPKPEALPPYFVLSNQPPIPPSCIRQFTLFFAQIISWIPGTYVCCSVISVSFRCPTLLSVQLHFLDRYRTLHFLDDPDKEARRGTPSIHRSLQTPAHIYACYLLFFGEVIST